MVRRQIAPRGIVDAAVLRAMAEVPREAFVPEALADHAFADGPLSIGEGQTISQPYIVALMTDALALRRTDRVLEIGTGSGYGAAVLASIAHEVHTVERHPSLAEQARALLLRLGYHNVAVHVGDGTLGWPESAPFDAISVTAGGPSVPHALLEQLAPGGRLIIPVGPVGGPQRLLRFVRAGDRFEETDLGPVLFVPLIGAGFAKLPA
jgi:protein-L-isoaspartate(D-aspartate) O-methyltransferase